MKAIKTTALILLGIVSFFFMAGEPTEEVTLAQFCIIKGLALLGFIATLLLSLDTARHAIDNNEENEEN